MADHVRKGEIWAHVFWRTRIRTPRWFDHRADTRKGWCRRAMSWGSGVGLFGFRYVGPDQPPLPRGHIDFDAVAVDFEKWLAARVQPGPCCSTAPVHLGFDGSSSDPDTVAVLCSVCGRACSFRARGSDGV